MTEELTYAAAGVDIDKANRLVDRIKAIAKSTARPGVMGDIGGFGGMFSLNVANMEKPVLVSSTDGVGTKLKIAFLTGRHDTVGIDLVAMSVNDIVVQGARPLFFLDYFSTGRLDEGLAEAVISGIGEGCRQAGCALIGGETAEMPGFYADNEYDLAGFAVGLVDNAKIIDGSEIRRGDNLVGIASSGLHSNGYSLVRKIVFASSETTRPSPARRPCTSCSRPRATNARASTRSSPRAGGTCGTRPTSRGPPTYAYASSTRRCPVRPAVGRSPSARARSRCPSSST